jgi:hypothetical protein
MAQKQVSTNTITVICTVPGVYANAIPPVREEKGAGTPRGKPYVPAPLGAIQTNGEQKIV